MVQKSPMKHTSAWWQHMFWVFPACLWILSLGTIYSYLGYLVIILDSVLKLQLSYRNYRSCAGRRPEPLPFSQQTPVDNVHFERRHQPLHNNLHLFAPPLTSTDCRQELRN